MFDWNDLRHFLALARGGSMGAAARTLGVDQSTVQRRLAFEKAVGYPLVERRRDGYGLTSQGHVLLSEATQVETAIDALQRRIATLDGSAQGNVTVASFVTVGQRIIKSGLLDRFHALYPGITVEMVMGQRLADLAKGEADIAIRGGGSGGSEALIGMKTADTPWGVYASRGFVERFGRPRDVNDLARFSIVELIPELERVPAVSWMQAHTQGAPIAARCGNVPSAVLAVKAGAGLAVLPAAHVAGDDELVCVLGPPQVPAYSLYLFVHKDLRRVPRVSAFFEFCHRELKPVLLTGAMRG